MKWYNKYNKIKKTGNLNCPNCNYQYIEEIMYFFSPYNCPNCKTELFFLTTIITAYHPYIYVVNLEKCPGLITNMFNYLIEKGNVVGAKELKELLDMISEET